MNPREIKMVGRLVLAHMRQHPGRVILTLLSTIAAACVVVYVVSGYDSLVDKFDEFAGNYLGRYEFVVLPVSSAQSSGGSPFGQSNTLSSELVAALQHDAAVAVVDPVFQTRMRFEKLGPDGKPVPPPQRGGGAFGGRGGRSGGRQFGGAAPAASPRSAVGISSRDDADSDLPAGASSALGRNSNGNPSGQPPAMPPGGFMNRSPMLVGTNSTEAPYPMVEGKWIDPGHPDRMEAVISQASAEQMDIKVGDEVLASSFRGEDDFRLKIIGIVEQRKPLPSTGVIIGLPASRGPPLTRGPASAAVYVPLPLAEKLADADARFSYVGVVLKHGFKPEEFRANWADRFASAKPPAEIQTLANVEAELNDSTTSETVKAQAYSATGISLLAALFIIFSTLSMGVHERIRQFAVLRAVSLTKLQVGAMIAIESVFLGIIGWVGGLLAGWGLISVMTRLKPELFPTGASLGLWCIALSGICALGGSLTAAIMPAWKATSVSPLEAMAPRQRQKSMRFSWLATILGLLLIAVNPLLVFWVPMEDTARYGMSAAIGCTCMAIGFVLLAPLAVVITERYLGPLVARLLGLNPKLLATQLTTNLWRTLGTAIALTLGLGLFVSMQTWGYSMLGPFTPGDWVPDLLFGLTPVGVPESEIDAVRGVKGIVAKECVPMMVEQTKFATDVTGAKIRANAGRQDNCVMIGVDPDLAIGGDQPVFKLKFVDGSASEAAEKLKRGRYCLVPDSFQRESGLGIGDKFGVVPPESPDEVIDYEIAGVVSMPGWHWMSKIGLRNRNGGRSAGLMLAGYDQVKRDFDLKRVTFFWTNMDGSATEEEIQRSLQKIAQDNFDPTLARGRRGGGMGMGGMGMAGPGMGGFGAGRRGYSATVSIRTREGVREAIRERASGIIWMLSQLPLVTLAVTSLGVINTILSSIRARRWDLGILRSLGVTRFGLFRLIIAEALLVGVVACLLSLGFGVMAGYCGTGITRYINVRGGQITPLIIPWTQILIGFGITLALCLLAALWPAFRTGRAEPLRLLQAGRAAM